MPATRMTAPILLGTGLADRLVPPRWQYGAAVALCAAGSRVTWRTYAGVTHNGGVNAAFDDALAFVKSLLAGEPVPGNCDAIAEPGAPGAPTPGVPFND
jgi:cephalosporin-C deacetylase-like acetyl esterase